MVFGIFTLQEIIDAIVMSFVMGLIFSDFFSRYNKKMKKQVHVYDPIEAAYSSAKTRIGPLTFNWEDIKFAIALIAPAIILHELGHKFVAMGFGVSATFNVPYPFLIIALILKVMNFPFLIVVPAFVSYPGGILSPFQSAWVALAGPLANFAIFFLCTLVLKHYKRITGKKLSERAITILGLTKKVNLFLGLFNMIPIRPFDGGQFLASVIEGISAL